MNSSSVRSANSVELRISITHLLEARGYISEEDVENESKADLDTNGNQPAGSAADRTADSVLENRLKNPDLTNLAGSLE
jgi:hypothetical protein